MNENKLLNKVLKGKKLKILLLHKDPISSFLGGSNFYFSPLPKMKIRKIPTTTITTKK